MSGKKIRQAPTLQKHYRGIQSIPRRKRYAQQNRALSGMTKQEYCYQKCMNREIVVQGNPRVYKALYTELKNVLSELQRIEAGGSVEPDLLEVIDQINVTLYGMSKAEN